MVADDAQGVEVPAPADFRRWAAACGGAEGSEVCVRIVGGEESAGLNRRYRGRAGPANVLSFPCGDGPLPPSWAGEPIPLGDVVITASVVAAEARAQGKPAVDHWAHVFVHGMLHLQGYDHMEERDARRMEEQEVRILRRLGFSNPYRPEFSGRFPE